MGRRRRKKIRKTQRVVPPIYKRYFTCPQCGSLSLSVTLRRIKGEERKHERLASVVCGKCGFKCHVVVDSLTEKIDVYNMVADMVYSGDISRCLSDEEAMKLVEGEEEGEGVEGEGAQVPAGEEEAV